MSTEQGLFTRLINLYSNRYLEYKIQHDLASLFVEKQNIEVSDANISIPDNKGISPIILLGMHRSGTTLMSKLLRQSGVYMGRLRGKDTDESLFFQNVNKSILKISGAFWDQPGTLNSFLESESNQRIFVDVLGQYCLNPQKTRTYFRGSNLGNSTLFNMQARWGWKDPRTCFTLPLWLNLYPKAKVIYIVRNGLDVAQSLVVRNKKLKGTSYFSERVEDLSGAFKLWEIYNEQCLINIKRLKEHQLLTLQYEDLLENPQVNLKKVFNFLEHSPNQPIGNIANEIVAKRAYAFTENADLVDYYKTVRESELMQKFGYADIC